MLQRIESEIREVRRLLVAINAKHGAFVVKFIGADDGKFFAHLQALLLA
jgi:hypothetical protein